MILQALLLHFRGYTSVVVNAVLPFIYRLFPVAVLVLDSLPQCFSLTERKQTLASTLQKACLQETKDPSNEVLIKILLDANADPNAVIAETGDTLLHSCVLRQHFGALQLLMQAKADVNALDHYGHSVSTLLQMSSQRPKPASLLGFLSGQYHISSPVTQEAKGAEFGRFRLRVHSISSPSQASLPGGCLEIGFRKLLANKIKLVKTSELKAAINLPACEQTEGELMVTVRHELSFNEWDKQSDILICLKHSPKTGSKPLLIGYVSIPWTNSPFSAFHHPFTLSQRGGHAFFLYADLAVT